MGDMIWKGRNLHRGREFWGQHHSHRISEFLIMAQLFQVSGHLPSTPPTVDLLSRTAQTRNGFWSLNPQWTYCPEHNTDTTGMASGAKTEATRYI